MNRVMKCLSNNKIDITWKKSRSAFKTKIETIFKNMINPSPLWTSMIATLIEGLVPKKVVAEKASILRTSIPDEEDDIVMHSGGRVCYRVALLACAIADSE